MQKVIATPDRRCSALPQRLLRRAVCASVGMHLGAFGALAYWNHAAPQPVRSRFWGQAQVIRLAAVWSEPTPVTAAAVPAAPQATVVVEPREARIEQQRFSWDSTQVEPSPSEIPSTDHGTLPPPAMPNHAENDAHADSPDVQDEVSHLPRQNLAAARRPAVSAAVPITPGMDVDVRPSFVDNPPPRYPVTAIGRRWEGTVLLEVTIDRDGRVLSVTVVQSSGHPILDAEAVQTVRQWRAIPARRAGAPILTTELLPIQFQLDDSQ